MQDVNMYVGRTKFISEWIKLFDDWMDPEEDSFVRSRTFTASSLKYAHQTPLYMTHTYLRST